MKRKFVFSCGIVGASLFIVASILGGLQIEGYSVVSQYISESYATGLPNTDYLRYMYMASGLLLALFAFLATTVLPSTKGVRVGLILFGIIYGLGTMITGFFPCDMGCRPDPEDATLSQFIHNTAGFLVYSIVPFCLIGIGVDSRKWSGAINISSYSLLCGALSLVFVFLLFGNPTGSMIGLFQRVIEGAILFWVIRTAFYMLQPDKIKAP